MFDAVFGGLDVAEHHGGAGVEAETVGDVHDFEPVVAHGFEGGDALADAVNEDFAAAAGYGAEAGGDELADDFFEGKIEDFAEVDKFAGAEAVDVDGGELLFDVAEEVEIPLHGKFWMMAALHEDLRAAEVEGFLNFLIDDVVSNDVGIIIFLDAIEGAELAIDVADVGVIDVAIDDVGGDLVAAAVEVGGFGELAAMVGEGAEFFEGEVVEAEGFGAVDAGTVPNALEEVVE